MGILVVACEDHVNLEADKLSREIMEPFILPLGGSDLNGDVLAVSPAEIAEPLPECREVRRIRDRHAGF